MFDFACFSRDEQCQNLVKFLSKIGEVSTRNDKKNKNGDLFTAVLSEEPENSVQYSEMSESESESNSDSDQDTEWDDEGGSIIRSFYDLE